MKTVGQSTVAGGGWGGDYRTPLPKLTFRERPPAPPSPTRIRNPQPKPVTVRNGPTRKGIPYGPRPDDWDNPLQLERSKVKEIISLYEGGMSAPDVAKTTGIAKSTVLRHLRNNGVQVRGATKALDDAAIIKAREAGATMRELAAQFGVAPATIARRLRDAEQKNE